MANTDDIFEDEFRYERIRNNIMSLPDMVTEYDSDFIAESNEDGTTHIKFMSDGGITDDQNGDSFAEYLTSKGCHFVQTRSRSMTVKNSDLIRLFDK